MNKLINAAFLAIMSTMTLFIMVLTFLIASYFIATSASAFEVYPQPKEVKTKCVDGYEHYDFEDSDCNVLVMKDNKFIKCN